MTKSRSAAQRPRVTSIALADVKPFDAYWSDPIVGDLRTDHAGETGAVWIYRGILTVSRNPEVRAFANEHLATEARHLALIEAVLPKKNRSALIPIWKVAGFLTGFLPALFGARAIFKTIEAVETFVDVHYQEQIDRIDEINGPADIRALLVECQSDEVHHRDDARMRAGDGVDGPMLRFWTTLVGAGSKAAVGAARQI